ncbi:DUF421 domain-containing protein [Rhizobium sp. LCM 4573]|uniref:DUF421 domain-containing protein n=1 Tax=Rhizobium sp. LCM 4573 TaxID=1848291 RepID=UPI0008D921E4|nr:YetF domain-containing protein [Rhizobium sp. LCM 4573]OHV84848.1 hypothetical protein LCM4573_04125 [Rhizobium sp. LCM 4573]
MESVIRGVTMYLVLLLIIRLSGRRTLSQMTPFDLVLTLMISETTQQAMVGEDHSIANAVILIVTLVASDILLSYVKRWWPTVGKAIDGVPTMLIVEGQVDERALQRSRIEMTDIMEAARQSQGIPKQSEIRFAILEASGRISIIPFKEG